ncbi:MAG TPA: (deoxy)nucleoside triphosphate pyrophosphohydrolase [Prolixibacteraceae bacterium]
MIEVCCAIIVKESKILAVQRGPKSSHPWKWEFPGGKVNLDETAEQCIVREIEEELTIRVVAMDRLSSVEFAYVDRAQISLIPFVCQILSGEITLREHSAQCWFHFDEWEALDWLEADRELILKNQTRLKYLVS